MKRGIRYFIYSLVALSLLVVSCSKDPVDYPTPEPEPENGDEPGVGLTNWARREARAVWFTTVWGLDWPLGITDQAEQKALIQEYLDIFEEYHINLIYFQVKGLGDAMYKSSYEPWSGYLTGVRGQDPGWDPLKYMIEESHKRNIELHAWVNPFRIASSAPFPPLHPSIKEEWVVRHPNMMVYNPAVPEARQRLADIVKEIVTNYDVDGIHFDDYFYPDPQTAGTLVSDKADYEKYGAEYKTIEEFRRANVHKAVDGVYKTIKQAKPNVVFSISPAASHEYTFSTMYADVPNMVRSGIVDVLIPQLYNASQIPSLIPIWSGLAGRKADMMIGLGVYKLREADNPEDFPRQVAESRKSDHVVGTSIYRSLELRNANIRMKQALKIAYPSPSIRPVIIETTPPAAPVNIKVEGDILKWSSVPGLWCVVSYHAKGSDKIEVEAITNKNELKVTKKGFYIVHTLNRQNVQSTNKEFVEYK